MAIHLDESFALAYNNRGFAHYKLGRFDAAVADCTRAVELDPHLFYAYNNRGLAYFRSGNLEQAITDFQTAIHLNPQYTQARGNLAVALKARAVMPASPSTPPESEFRKAINRWIHSLRGRSH